LDRHEKAVMAQRAYYRNIWLDRLNKTTKTSGLPYSSRNRNVRLPNKAISNKIYRWAQAMLIKLFTPSLFPRNLTHGLSEKAD